MKKFKYIFSLLFMLVAFASCMDDDITDFGQGPQIVQFVNTSAAENFLKTDTNPTYEYDIPVELFGGKGLPAEQDITLTVSVASTSTAQEGVHFNFISGKQVVIPAGEYAGALTIEVLTEDLDALDPPLLVLQIDSSSETVSDNNMTEIVLQAICPSDLSGDWVYTNGYQRDVTITEVGSGLFQVSADNAFSSPYSFVISDVCGQLTVVSAYIEDNFGIPVSGYGEVNADGSISLIYTVEGYLTNRPMELSRN